MKWLDRLIAPFKNTIVTEMEVTNEPEPYLTFPCEECKNTIVIENFIFPGDVCVVKCDNCNESWSVYCRSLEISKTSEFEDVWSHIAEDTKQSVPFGEV